MCPGSRQDRVHFCSRQEGTWPRHRNYSIPTHIIARGREKELSSEEKEFLLGQKMWQRELSATAYDREGVVGGSGMCFLCE